VSEPANLTGHMLTGPAQ